jgi:hypothetical protein
MGDRCGERAATLPISPVHTDALDRTASGAILLIIGGESVELALLIDAIRAGRVHITDHADEEAQADDLSFEEVYFTVLHGEVIEDYPTDRPYPSCLVLGKTFRGEPVHSVWAYHEGNRWAVLVTVYRPDPTRWQEWKTRRRP